MRRPLLLKGKLNQLLFNISQCLHPLPIKVMVFHLL